jgi:nucleoside-diphosphate-sugar epimerase
MIFVTGGTGLLGSHLLFQLTNSDVQIKAIYRDKAKIDAVVKLFTYYDPIHFKIRLKMIKWVQCDILDIVSLGEELASCNTVYHCAALVSFYKKDFYQLMKINREGTANIVNTCLKFNISKLCYVSSTAAIGNEDKIVTEHTKWKQSPLTSGYSISKYSAEKEVWRGVEEGLNAVIVNPCLLIGAGNWKESSMTIFKTVDDGLKFYTTGANAFVDARDVAEIMEKLMNSDIQNERFLCIGENSSFANMLTIVAQKLNKKAPYIKVSKILMKLTWIISGIVSKIIGKKPVITKETANSAFSNTIYDASKVKNALNFQFKSLEESISNAVKGRIY